MENAHHNKLIFVVLINIFQGILVLTLYFLLWKIIEQELFGCFWLHCSFITSAGRRWKKSSFKKNVSSILVKCVSLLELHSKSNCLLKKRSNIRLPQYCKPLVTLNWQITFKDHIMQIFRQILHVQKEAWKIILPNSASKLTQIPKPQCL